MHPQLAPCAVIYGGKPARGYKLVCSVCKKCEQKHFGYQKGIQDDAPDRKVLRLYEKDGWSIKPGRALCPTCRENRAKQMRAFHATKNKNGHAPHDATPPPSPVPPVPPVIPTLADDLKYFFAEKTRETPMKTPTPPPGGPPLFPKTPTFKDKQLIWEKLAMDAYDTDKQSYRSEWTDQVVATQLNMPLAWIKELREQNFGPTGVNPEIAAVLTIAKEFKAEMISWESRVKDLTKLNNDLLDLGKSLAHKADIIDKRLDAIQKATGAK